MGWYMEALRNYFVFDGRSRRSEFWVFTLASSAIAFLLSLVDELLGTTTRDGLGVFNLLFNLAVLLPSLTVSVRRLHDTGRSGWWLLVVFVPVVGALALLYWFVLDSDVGGNRYGANPKGQ